MKRMVWPGMLAAGVIGLAFPAQAAEGFLGSPAELGDPSGSEVSEPLHVERDEPEAPPRKKKPGTHFIGELRLGSTLDGPGELAYGGVLGVGGRWYSLPPIYLFGSVDHTSSMRTTRSVDGYGYGYDEYLSLTSVGTGLRVYVPVAGPFRILADITVGAIATRARFDDGGGAVVEDLWLPYTELGIGPQFRIFHHLSLGARASFAFIDVSALDRNGPASAWEGELDQKSSVLGTATLHF